MVQVGSLIAVGRLLGQVYLSVLTHLAHATLSVVFHHHDLISVLRKAEQHVHRLKLLTDHLDVADGVLPNL